MNKINIGQLMILEKFRKEFMEKSLMAEIMRELGYSLVGDKSLLRDSQCKP